VVNQRENRIHVYPESETTGNIWIPAEPVISLDATATDEAKGKAVLEALSASRQQVPHPASPDDCLRPLLRAAGVSSYTKYAKGTRSCSVTQDSGRHRLLARRNRGKGAFEGIPGKAIVLESPSAEDLGRAVMETLAMAE
jgi:hypothetical protein